MLTLVRSQIESLTSALIIANEIATDNKESSQLHRIFIANLDENPSPERLCVAACTWTTFFYCQPLAPETTQCDHSAIDSWIGLVPTITNFFKNSLKGEDRDAVWQILHKENRMVVQTANYQATFYAENVSNWPGFTIEQDETWMPIAEIDAISLKRALAAALTTVSLNETKAVYSGVIFHFQQDQLYIAGIEPVRAITSRIRASMQNEHDSLTFVLHKYHARQLQQAIGEKQTPIHLYLRENPTKAIFAKNGPVCFGCVLVQVEINNFSEIMQKLYSGTPTVTITLNTKDILNALKAAQTFDVSYIAICAPNAQNIVIEGTHFATGHSYRFTLPAQIEFKNATSLKIYCDHEFLRNAIAHTRGEAVQIDCCGSTQPIIVTNPDNDNYRAVIMPIAFPTSSP